MRRETKEARRQRIDAIMREQGAKLRSPEEAQAFLHLLDCQFEREIARADLLEAELRLDAARHAIDRWEHRAPEIRSLRAGADILAQQSAYLAQAKLFKTRAAELDRRLRKVKRKTKRKKGRK